MKGLRFLWLAPRYCLLGGGEIALHSIATEMCRQGAKVRVVSGFATPRQPFPLPEGMDVLWTGKTDEAALRNQAVLPDVNRLAKEFNADVVLVYCEWMVPMLRTVDRPVGVYCCSLGTYPDLKAAGVADRADFWITASRGLANLIPVRAPRMVLYPYVARPETAASARKANFIGVVNRSKGKALVAALARTNPTRSFLGLEGSYGKQAADWPQNVTCIPQTKQMGTFYERLRVLLVPDEETFSLAGVEAQAAGVPIVSLDTPILRESLGEGALFCKPTVAAFQQALQRLDGPAEYAALSARARANAARYDMRESVRVMLDGVRAVLHSKGRVICDRPTRSA